MQFDNFQEDKKRRRKETIKKKKNSFDLELEHQLFPRRMLSSAHQI